MLPRFFCPALAFPSEEIALPPAVAHHADRVLRLKPGQEVILFDGDGREARVELVTLGREPMARVVALATVDREPPLAITLVQALATGDKMDWIVQKAVELGVARFQPIAAERSVLRLDGERAVRRVEHWRQVAVSAAEQCGRNRLMVVEPITSLPGWLSASSCEVRWALDPEAGQRLGSRGAPQGPVALLIGPEGGWAERELAALRAAGCEGLTLGPRVLRTETAGLAAVAAMLALWGDF